MNKAAGSNSSWEERGRKKRERAELNRCGNMKPDKLDVLGTLFLLR